jgi:hypothetical protein
MTITSSYLSDAIAGQFHLYSLPVLGDGLPDISQGFEGSQYRLGKDS